MIDSKITHQDYIEYNMLVAEGYSQRKACEALSIPRSTMQDYLKRVSEQKAVQETVKQVQKKKARIFIIDIETSCGISATFGRRKIFLSQDHVIREEGKILCFSYREVGCSETYLVGMTQEEAIADDDSRIVAEIWELFEKADAIVAHNAQKFDFPAIKSRVLANAMPPLPIVKVIDTLVMARKNFKLPSNSLDSIAAYLGIKRKKDAGGIRTWILYSEGDLAAMEHMHTYCKADVDVLHDVYMKLRSFGHIGSDFNAAHYVDEHTEMACNVCAASVYKTGRNIYTSVSKFEEVRCSSCGNVSRTRVTTYNKEEVAHFTLNVKLNG